MQGNGGRKRSCDVNKTEPGGKRLHDMKSFTFRSLDVNVEVINGGSKLFFCDVYSDDL